MRRNAATRQAASKRASDSPARGFALLLVMILVVSGVVLGFAYLSSASLKVTIANNYCQMSRARYLAESGLEHALFTLRFDPDAIENKLLGPYYADDSSDYYYVYAQKAPESDGLYRLTAIAIVGGVQRSSSMTIYRSPGEQIQVEQGIFVASGAIWLPWGLTLNGDVHVNGALYNMALVNGDATTTGSLSDPWERIDGSTDDDADPVDAPDIQLSDYFSYSVSGENSTATQFENADMTASTELANGGAITETNQAGVVRLDPNVGDTLTLHDNLNFTGTIIVQGDLVLDGSNIELTATDGFPAIIVTGTIYVTDRAQNVTINGLVVANQGIDSDGWTPNASTTINGAVVSTTVGYNSALSGNHTLNYDADRAAIYNINSEPEDRIPEVTMREWND